MRSALLISWPKPSTRLLHLAARKSFSCTLLWPSIVTKVARPSSSTLKSCSRTIRRVSPNGGTTLVKFSPANRLLFSQLIAILFMLCDEFWKPYFGIYGHFYHFDYFFEWIQVIFLGVPALDLQTTVQEIVWRDAFTVRAKILDRYEHQPTACLVHSCLFVYIECSSEYYTNYMLLCLQDSSTRLRLFRSWRRFATGPMKSPRATSWWSTSR